MHDLQLEQAATDEEQAVREHFGLRPWETLEDLKIVPFYARPHDEPEAFTSWADAYDYILQENYFEVTMSRDD